MTLKILGSVRAPEQWAAAGEFRKRLLAAFEANGIEIPGRSEWSWRATRPPSRRPASPPPSSRAARTRMTSRSTPTDPTEGRAPGAHHERTAGGPEPGPIA